MQSRTPFSTDGMKLRGTAPPKMSSTNSKPPPRCIGSTRSHVSPYWPRPPVCFLYFPWPSARPFTVSDRKSTRLNSSHGYISYAVFCLKKKKKNSYITIYPAFESHIDHLSLALVRGCDTFRCIYYVV